MAWRPRPPLPHETTPALRFASALAWLAGLAAFLAFAMPLWQPGQRLAQVVAIGLAGGLLMAATMAAVTGFALVRLLRPDPRPGDDAGRGAQKVPDDPIGRSPPG
jgi:hypothetical protein